MSPYPYADHSVLGTAARAKSLIGVMRQASVTVEFDWRIMVYGTTPAGDYMSVVTASDDPNFFPLPSLATGYPHLGLVPAHPTDPIARPGNMLPRPPAGLKPVGAFTPNLFINFTDIYDEFFEDSEGEGFATEEHRRLSLRFRLSRPEHYDDDIQTLRKDMPFRVSFARVDRDATPPYSIPTSSSDPLPLYSLGNDSGYFSSAADPREWGPWSGWIVPGGPYAVETSGTQRSARRHSLLGRPMLHIGPTYAMTRQEAHANWG